MLERPWAAVRRGAVVVHQDSAVVAVAQSETAVPTPCVLPTRYLKMLRQLAPMHELKQTTRLTVARHFVC